VDGGRDGLHRNRLLILGAVSALMLVALATGAWLLFGRATPMRPAAARLTDKIATASTPEKAASLASGTVFRDCPDVCPPMVVVPAGSFLMGSPGDDRERHSDEIPQHAVTIGRAFAISQYPVTRAEFARFASETGRTADDSSCFTLTGDGRFIETPKAGWRDPGFPQTSRDPVVCMSWNDADAYADWLGRKTAKPYRLPSEAEWEYAARAGATAAHPGAPSQICRLLNGGDADYHAKFPGDPKFDGACRDGYAYTSPVGSFPANAFGLFDMTGNVGQWVADCYNTTYDGAPSDGSAWTSGNCAMRVNRGGAWTDSSQNLRFASRPMDSGVGRFSSVGIRVARAL
jgi:formylglycine-generating enzyme required for sulfatase activity